MPLRFTFAKVFGNLPRVVFMEIAKQ